MGVQAHRAAHRDGCHGGKKAQLAIPHRQTVLTSSPDYCGIDVSSDLISTVTDAVLAEFAAWQARPLGQAYSLVFFVAIRAKIRDEGMLCNKAIHIARGVMAHGTKVVLGLCIEQNEGAKLWLCVTNELKNRGLEAPGGFCPTCNPFRSQRPRALIHQPVSFILKL